MTENLKPLADLRTEVELGMIVYPSTNHDADVRYAEGWYIFGRSSATPVECEAALGWSHGERVTIGGDYENGEFVGGGVIFDDCYRTFEALLADWPSITSQPVWGPTKTFERRLWEKREAEEYKQRTTEQGLVERMQSWGLEHAEVNTLDELKAAIGKHAHAQIEREESVSEQADESIVPLNSQLGQDASRLINHYFPSSTITEITSEYHRGVFIGDFSIKLMCTVSHSVLVGAVISFNQHSVPGRPATWEELCACQIDLYAKQFTLNTPDSSHTLTYGLPGMYEEEMNAWCKTHDDGMLYSYVETPDMFIITTELLSHSHEEVQQTAKLLAVQAKAKLEQMR